jgi:transposase
LAHLRRHFKKVLLLSHGNNTVVAEAFLELIDEAFRQHREWRQNPDYSLDYHTWASNFGSPGLLVKKWGVADSFIKRLN